MGRTLLRAARHPTLGVDVVAVNDPEPPEAPLRLLARDSVFGPLEGPIRPDDQVMVSDAELTMARGRMAEVIGWYDDERGYSDPLAELSALAGTAPRL